MITALRDLWAETTVVFWLVLAASLYYLVMAARLTVIDIKHQLLPNRIGFPSAAVAGVLPLSASLLMPDGVALSHPPSSNQMGHQSYAWIRWTGSAMGGVHHRAWCQIVADTWGRWPSGFGRAGEETVGTR